MKILRIERRGILVIVLFFIAETLFLFMPFGTSSDTDIRYFLSATSQTLAALYALVFTIVPVVGQMASVHSNRLFSSLFDRITIFYMCFFAFSVVFPLIVLKGYVFKQGFEKPACTMWLTIEKYLCRCYFMDIWGEK